MVCRDVEYVSAGTDACATYQLVLRAHGAEGGGVGFKKIEFGKYAVFAF